MDKVLDYIRSNHDRYLAELVELLKIPSISSEKQHKGDMKTAARHLAARMKKAGLGGVKVIPTKGHPAVYGEWCKAGKDKPTVLVYGHYDVQPVDPLNLWKTPPFEPSVRPSNRVKGAKDLYARGAADDKGQLFIHLLAAEAHLEINGSLPLNVKFIFEGEEEIGSPNLVPLMKKHKSLLKCDSVVVSDTPMFDYGKPSICYGLRGLSFMEVHVTGPNSDLHSGTFGGIAANPINVLCEMVAKLTDKRGKVAIPGFYDDVVRLTAAERKAYAALKVSDTSFKRQLGVRELAGEKGYSAVERQSARPTLDVNGISGGYEGKGAKTVIASKAMAKISMRLVPNQDPKKIARLFTKRIKELAPRSVRVEVFDLHGGDPAMTALDNPATQAAMRALKKAFGKKVLTTREGGSIPIVADFQKILGAPTVLMGFGVPDENLHAPNEKLHLPNFFTGIEASAHYFTELAG
jgi:acetylornithine deacetylase/succinyl-diaminopimelate desuccinylase-like protein